MEGIKYTYGETIKAIDRLMLYYPFVEKITIGNSVMGKEIPALKIGTGNTQVCYSGAFHANEWITVPVLLRFAEEFAAAAAAGESLYGVDGRWLYQQVSCYLIPLLNPDGVDLVTGGLTEGSYYEQAKAIAAAYPEIPFLTAGRPILTAWI